MVEEVRTSTNPTFYAHMYLRVVPLRYLDPFQSDLLLQRYSFMH